MGYKKYMNSALVNSRNNQPTKREKEMTPQEKAIELVNKYFVQFQDDSGCGWNIDCAKKCALININEILDELDPEVWGLEMNVAFDRITYWHMVVHEIVKIE